MSQYVKKIRTESGDLQIDYNALANLPELNTMFSNPNLLINSDCRNPVNQRGEATYTDSSSGGTWMYTIDRWRIKGVVLTVNENSITITNNGSSANSFQQPVGYYFPTGTYTASCKVLSVVGNVSMGVTNSTNNPTLDVGVNSHTWTDATIGSLSIALDAGASVELEWIKLEVGSVATAFAPRLYGEELALCQRYYEKRTVIFFPYGGVNPTTYYLAVNGSDHRVTKCQLPKITASALTDHNNVAVDVSFVSATQTKDNIRLMTVSAACDEYLLRSDIEFDAEIY